MGDETNPQWAEVERMLRYVGEGPRGRTGTLYSDEARLILKAIGKPEALARDKIAFLITDLCDQHLEYDPELGICNTGSMAFKAADQVMAWVTGGDNEAARLRAGIIDLIALCDQDAVDQDHNATLTSWGRRSRPYAIGRGTACKGIATRLRSLIDSAQTPPEPERCAAACHDEQMEIWSGEIVGSLAMGDYLRDDLSYDDKVDIHALVAKELRSILGSSVPAPSAPSAEGGR